MLDVDGDTKRVHVLLADRREQLVEGPIGVGMEVTRTGLLMELDDACGDPAIICDVLRQLSTGSGPDAEICAAAEGYAGDVANYLSYESAEVQVAACLALQAMGADAAGAYSSYLVPLLQSSEPSVRAAAAQAYGVLGDRGPGSANEVAALFKDQDELVCSAALRAAGALGDEDQLEAMASNLGNKAAEVNAGACHGVGLLGGEKADTHSTLIAEQLELTRVRPAALEGLIALGATSVGKHAKAIAKCLSDPDLQTRHLAISALAIVEDADASVVDAVVEQTKSQDAGARAAAALALGRLGSAAALKQAQALADLLQDDGDDVSWKVHQVGGGIVRPHPSLKKPRCAALLGLGMLGKVYAESNDDTWELSKQIGSQLQEEDWEVRHCALEGVCLMGEKAGVDTEPILDLLDDDVYLIRAKALDALGIMKANDMADQMSDLLADSTPSVRAAACSAIGRLGEDGGDLAPKLYKRLVKDGANIVRAAAAEALGHMGEYGRAYAGIIASMLQEGEPDYGVRCAMLSALGEFGPYGAAFAEEVADYLHDAAPPVRAAAAKALGKMGGDAAAYAGMISGLSYDAIPEVASAAKEALLALEA